MNYQEEDIFLEELMGGYVPAPDFITGKNKKEKKVVPVKDVVDANPVIGKTDKKLDFDILTVNQVFNLDIFENDHGICPVTDFAKLLGIEFSLDSRGPWWTKTPANGVTYVSVVPANGLPKRVFSYTNALDWKITSSCTIGCRPIIKYSTISKYCNNVRNLLTNVEKDKSSYTLCVDFGEYPQSFVDDKMYASLEQYYHNNALAKTGKTYCFNDIDVKSNQTEKLLNIQNVEEYEFENRKYVRITPKFKNNDFNSSIYWLEVKPITWYIDEKSGLAISEKILFSGIPFNIGDYNNDFSKTTIKIFLDEYFANDILTIDNLALANINTVDSKINDLYKKVVRKKQNPYNFDYSSVEEEDIIKGAIESNVAVFLHGLSGDGKSARVAQYDPKCIPVVLAGKQPEDIVGISAKNKDTGKPETLPPPWYEELCELCEAEPDKIHIVFFDELPNAYPKVQSLIFDVVYGNRIGKYKLPKNARVALAGNETKDSLASSPIAEPLFNRCAHVYIDTTPEEWLEWALSADEEPEGLEYHEEEKRHKIHPSIYAFIACHGDALRTDYTGVKPNADPRKWELASKILYTTNKPEMLRALVGEELTKQFVAFTNNPVITLDDVLKGNYTDEDFKIDAAKQYATAVALSKVDEDNFKTVRAFMQKFKPEICSTFESLWAGSNKKRLQMLLDFKNEKIIRGGL